MKVRFSALASALAIVASTAAPALAEGGNPVIGVAMWPVKAVAMTTRAVVGTPIAITRYVAKESVASTKNIAGDKGNPVVLAGAGLLGVPIGLFVGGIEGMYYGPANAYSKTDRKEAFSLGEIE